MNKEKQRIKIAEACGLNVTSNTICPYCKGITPYEAGDDYGITIWAECKTCNNTGKVKPYYTSLPDYLNDLNAMHEAEKACLTTIPLVTDYGIRLVNALHREHKKNPRIQDTSWRIPVVGNCGWFATAAQRAESFLRNLNLWEE